MHGYKKPKSEWSKKKRKNGFTDFDEGWEKNNKNKKSKRYYRDNSNAKFTKSGYDDNNYDDYE